MAPENLTLRHESIARTQTTISASQRPNLQKDGNVDVHDDVKSICDTSFNVQTEDEEEIPIWICGEPRYVSGITNKTTCNDIIRALIEDEVDHIDGIENANCLSRDFCDYVITEKWRDIEQALPGETFILPIWSEWGVAQNEVKLKLKINKTGTEHSNCRKDKNGRLKQGRKFGAISKLIRKVVRQGEAIHNQLSNYRLNPSINGSSKHNKIPKDIRNLPLEHDPCETSYFKLPHVDELHTDDEILLVLHPNDDDKDSGINIQPGVFKDKVANRELDSISEISDLNLPYNSLRFSHPKLNKFAKHEFVSSTPHSASRRRRSLQFNIIRNEIVETTQRIEDLLQDERCLAKCLTDRRDKYRVQNQLYRTKAGLDMCFEEIQKNLSVYGKDIVDKELDLYKVKKEVQRKCIVLNNLKRMLRGEECSTRYESIRCTKQVPSRSNKRNSSRRSDLQFVDNFYEFCDNNESIIV